MYLSKLPKKDRLTEIRRKRTIDSDTSPSKIHHRAAMDQPTHPYKPGTEERDNYFFGLSGNPKLIARTSTVDHSSKLEKTIFFTRPTLNLCTILTPATTSYCQLSAIEFSMRPCQRWNLVCHCWR
ncbi:hypothetical protein F4775DRAFT_555128 [Biscogniauxia sp. FL1348]|nr:hypothetical protein F4775DRAFT_555128 [Biscogniauxia sp. FL1348]